MIGSVFFLILHSNLFLFKLLFGLRECSFWLINWQFFPSALKTTKFTNFHRPHSVFTDFQGLEKRIPFSPNFQRPCEPGTTDSASRLTSLVPKRRGWRQGWGRRVGGVQSQAKGYCQGSWWHGPPQTRPCAAPPRSGSSAHHHASASSLSTPTSHGTLTCMDIISQNKIKGGDGKMLMMAVQIQHTHTHALI